MRIFDARTLRSLLWVGLAGGLAAIIGVVLSLTLGLIFGGVGLVLLALWLVPPVWALNRVTAPGAGVLAGLVAGIVVALLWPLYWPAVLYSLLYAAAVEVVYLCSRYRRSNVVVSVTAGVVGGSAIAVHWLLAWVQPGANVAAVLIAPVVGGVLAGAAVGLLHDRRARSRAAV